MSNHYRPGDYKAECSMCMGEFYASELIKHWQGFWRCKRCWEPRHPQDFVRAGRPEAPVPWVQKAADVEVTNICTLEGRTAIPGLAIPYCSLPMFTGGLYPVVPGPPGDSDDNGGDIGGDPGGNPGWAIAIPLTIEVDYSDDENPILLSWVNANGPFTLEVAEGAGEFQELEGGIEDQFKRLGSGNFSGMTEPAFIRVRNANGDFSGARIFMFHSGNTDNGLGQIEPFWERINAQGYVADRYDVYGISAFGWNGSTMFGMTPKPQLSDMALMATVDGATSSALVNTPGLDVTTSWGIRIVAYRNDVRIADSLLVEYGVPS